MRGASREADAPAARLYLDRLGVYLRAGYVLVVDLEQERRRGGGQPGRIRNRLVDVVLCRVDGVDEHADEPDRVRDERGMRRLAVDARQPLAHVERVR